MKLVKVIIFLQLTSKIEIDCMAEITTTRDSSKKRCNWNKLKVNSIWRVRNSLQPHIVTIYVRVASSL